MTAESIELPPTLTVEEALTLYLERVSARKSPQAHERERRKARQISARLGRVLLRELTPLDLSGYRDQRLREASAAIVQGDLSLLEELCEVAARDWRVVLAGNPVHGVSPPRPPAGRTRSFERGELVRLLAACDRRPTPLLGWVVRLALETALAKDEILRVRRGDLDLKARVVTLPKLLSRPMRQAPLSREAVRLFREVLSYPERPEEEELLFFGAVGRLGIRLPLTIDKAFRAALLQARLKGFRFNDLRDEAITRMLGAGLSVVEVNTIAGLPLPRLPKRPVRPAVAELVARLDAVGFGVGVADGNSERGVSPRGARRRAVSPATGEGVVEVPEEGEGNSERGVSPRGARRRALPATTAGVEVPGSGRLIVVPRFPTRS